MEELKTLKEIFEKSKYKDIIERELKAEAVKWVKEWKKQIKESNINVELSDEQKAGYIFGITNFKHFFNLTEEDLK